MQTFMCSILEITFIKNIDCDQHITDISPKANNDFRFPLGYLAFAHKSEYGQLVYASIADQQPMAPRGRDTEHRQPHHN